MVVANITDAQADYVSGVTKTLAEQGFRSARICVTRRSAIKSASIRCSAPYLLVIGDREKENGAVAVRTRSGEDLGSMSLQAFIERLHAEGA